MSTKSSQRPDSKAEARGRTALGAGGNAPKNAPLPVIDALIGRLPGALSGVRE